MAKWKPDDYAKLASSTGIVEVPVWPDLPPILVDARGYQALAMLGQIENPLLIKAIDALMKADDTAKDADGTEKAFWQLAMETAELQDELLAFLIREPSYAPKSAYVDGKIPDGCIGYYSFTGQQRRAIVEFFYSGMEAMSLFRPGPGADEHAARNGDGPQPPAEPLVPVANGASEVVAGRGGDQVGAPAGRPA